MLDCAEKKLEFRVVETEADIPALGTDVLLTTIHNINVRRDVRESLSGGRVALGLMAGAKSWSKTRGAKEILLHVTSGVDLARSHKFAKRMGFDFVGGSYVATS